MRRVELRAAVLLVVVACGDSGRSRASGSRVETIGGVEHVLNEGTPPVWRLERERAIGRLGTAEGAPSPDEFGRIRWLALHQDGSLYVADGAAAEVRVFDTTGVHVRTIGRRGQGPGEFITPQAIAFLGDTLLVLDPGNGRIALLDRTGAHLDQWPYPAMSGSADWIHSLGRDTLRMMTIIRGTRPSRRGYVALTGAGPGDTLMAPEAPPRDAPRGMDCEGIGGTIHVYSTPLAPRYVVAPAPGGALAAAWSDVYRIAFLTGAGDTVRVVERSGESFTVPDTMRLRVDSAYTTFRATPGLGTCTPSTLPDYTVLPPLNHLMFDDAGRLWVEVLDGSGRRWDVFSPDGELVGSARGNPRLDAVRPTVRDRRLAVVEEAPEGHHRVVVYRLIESG